MSAIALVVPPVKNGFVISDYMAGLGMKTSGSESCLPPLDFLYAASILRQKGHRVSVIDSPAQRLNEKDLFSLITQSKPEKIFVDIRFPSFTGDLDIARRLKSHAPFVAVSAPMAALLADEIRRRYDFDRVVEGNPITGIPLAVEGRIADDPRLPDLDTLPYPAREMVADNDYFFRTLPKGPFTTMITSQGCPYGCIYCPYHTIQGDLVRKRRAGDVVEELAGLYAAGYRSVLFRDPVFTFDRAHVEKICSGIISRNIRIDWWCETRTDTLDAGILTLMKRAGVRGVNFGVESGDNAVLAAAGRKSWEQERTREVIALCRRYGIGTKGFFILGLPGEDTASLKRTIECARNLDPDYAVFMIAMPFPGTKLFDLYLKDRPVSDFFTGRPVYYIPGGLTLGELERFRKLAVRSFYLRPRHVLREVRLSLHPKGMKEAVTQLKWLVSKS